mgnify:CR=1 FL=1
MARIKKIYYLENLIVLMFFSSGIGPRHSWMAMLTPWIDKKTQKKIQIFDYF